MDPKLRPLPIANRARPSRPRHTLATAIALGALALIFLHRADLFSLEPFFPAQPPPRAPDSADFRPAEDESPWIHIEPSRTIEWHDCFGGQFDCARLDVPMDWQNPSDDDRVILAVIRLRAKNPEAANYRGPLIFNPGGPGGSGVFSLRDHGAALQTIAGDNYDIVSFDPRGIGASVPRVECWSSEQNRMLWELQDAGVADLHAGALYQAYARAKAFSKKCEVTMGRDSILQHSSTTSHARDMLEILEQMGWKKLTYWGFSYGTVLGGTFAAMYPDRVERLVSDGNVDLKEWYYGKYIQFLHDADKVMDAFYVFCQYAGPGRCEFHNSTTDAIKNRLDTLLEAIRMNPVVIPASAEGPEIPEVVTYTEVKRLISTMLYQPVWFFRLGAQILAALEKGDGRLYYKFMTDLSPRPSSFCAAETIPPMVPISGSSPGTNDAFPAIMCADRHVNDTVEELEEYAKKLQAMSSAAGAVQIVFRLSCEGWDVVPKWRFDGPFAGNTSFPILYVANIADNVTPLISARNNSESFPGSVVLVQNSYGHTSLAAPSTCTARYIREYFQEGKLPAKDTVCEADVVPFYDQEFEAAGVLEGDDGLSAAVAKLSRNTNWGFNFRPMHF